MNQAQCLLVSDGRRGIENQALGLGEALADRVNLQLTTLKLSDQNTPPPPDIAPQFWIGCGRAAVNAAPAHKRALPNTRFIYVQDPRANYDLFDLIVAPRHDRLQRDNVFQTLGSPNRITAKTLSTDAAQFAERLKRLNAPRVAVLIGGQSKRHSVSPEREAYILNCLDRLLALGASLMITDSRRTANSLRNQLRERFANHSSVWLHADNEPNPYFAFLNAADWICVTEDSTNMLTEAASTGKPVYRLGMDGKPGKFRELYAALQGGGMVRPFLGQLDHWTYTPLHETARAADHILEIFSGKTEL